MIIAHGVGCLRAGDPRILAPALKMIVPWVAPTLLSMSALQGAYIQGNVCATPIHFHGFWVPASRRA